MNTEAEIVVMYENLEIVRLPWDRRSELKRDGVLFVVISFPSPNDGLNHKPRKRQQSAHDKDWYVLSQDGDLCLLGGFDVSDYAWKSLTNPWAGHPDVDKVISIDNPPTWFPKDSIFLEGYTVTKEVWEQALELYINEMY